MKALLLLLLLLFNIIQSDRDVCDIDRKDKVDCGGYFGMSQQKCEEMEGCCFKPNFDRSPWCYKRRVELIARPEGELREELKNGGKRPFPPSDAKLLGPDDIVIPK